MFSYLHFTLLTSPPSSLQIPSYMHACLVFDSLSLIINVSGTVGVDLCIGAWRTRHCTQLKALTLPVPESICDY